MDPLEEIVIDPSTFLRQHCTLPALPSIVAKIQELLVQDSVDIKKVAEYLEGEPSLVAQILKVANSAYYSLPREVTSVHHAVAFLGLAEVHRIVLALSVVNTVAISDPKWLEDFWLHSYYVSVASKLLAKIYDRYLSHEELWTASILHDAGKLVYMRFYPDHYKALKDYCADKGVLFSEAEIDMSMPASGYLGELLCQHWRLPDNVNRACSQHRLMDVPALLVAGTEEAAYRYITAANLAAILATEELNEVKVSEVKAAIQSLLGIGDSELLELMGKVYELRMDVERFVTQLL